MITTKEDNKKLIEDYPFLLPRNDWTGEVPQNYDYEFTWLDEMPDVWREKFSEPMLKELKEILVEGDYILDYRIMQIKEKYASLRWYSNGIPDKIFDKYCEWESKYEKLSESICFYCGEPAIGQTRGWILSVCQKCTDKQHINIRLFTSKEEEMI